MKISAKGRYSMQALFDLAHHSQGQPVPLHAIAQRQDLSLPFLEQIFNTLKKAGIVQSVRGPRGGYLLAKSCADLRVGEVLRLTDGPDFLPEGTEQGESLQADQQMNQLLWIRFNEHLSAFLDQVSFADLCSQSTSHPCPRCRCPETWAELRERGLLPRAAIPGKDQSDGFDS